MMSVSVGQAQISSLRCALSKLLVVEEHANKKQKIEEATAVVATEGDSG